MSPFVRATNPFKVKKRIYWYIKITVTDPDTGHERHLKKTTGIKVKSKDSLSKAHEARVRLLAEHQTTHDPLAPLTVKAFSVEYIRERESEQLSNASIRGINEAFKRFLKVVGETRLLQHIVVRDIRQFLFNDHQTPSVALADYRYLRAAFERAMRDEKIIINPFNQIDKKALRKRFRQRPRGILTAEQVVAIYELLPKNNFPNKTFANYFLLLFGTAFRRGEACYLETSNVCIKTRVIQVRASKDHKLKTEASADDIPMTEYSLIAIKEQFKNKAAHPSIEVRNSKFIFCNSYGEHYDPPSFTKRGVKAIKEACKTLGIDREGIDLHSLRHSLIQHLIDSGVQPAIVSKFARHASLSTTLSAYHKTKDTKTKFEEVLLVTSSMPKPTIRHQKNIE